MASQDSSRSMKRWLLGCLLACHSQVNDVPLTIAKDVNNSSSVSIDAGEDVVDTVPVILPKKILLIGDSQVRYLSWYMDRAGVKQPNETVFFDSKPGTTILTWNNIFVREMSKYPNIDEVLIFLGTNNFNFGFLQDHQNILNEIKRRNVKCLWIGPTNVRMNGFKNLHMIGPLIKKAVEPVCKFFDTEAAGIELADGIHPSLDGAVKWLRDIWKVK